MQCLGVDSLTAMVCGSAPPTPAPPGGMSCQQKCEAAGHCATGLISCGQSPSCGQGCEVAAAGATLEQCKAVCLDAGTEKVPGQGAGCTHKYKNLTLQSCAGCAQWNPQTQQKPPGISPYANCGQNTIGALLLILYSTRRYSSPVVAVSWQHVCIHVLVQACRWCLPAS
jgi:hypothetical protein